MPASTSRRRRTRAQRSISPARSCDYLAGRPSHHHGSRLRRLAAHLGSPMWGWTAPGRLYEVHEAADGEAETVLSSTPAGKSSPAICGGSPPCQLDPYLAAAPLWPGSSPLPPPGLQICRSTRGSHPAGTRGSPDERRWLGSRARQRRTAAEGNPIQLAGSNAVRDPFLTKATGSGCWWPPHRSPVGRYTAGRRHAAAGILRRFCRRLFRLDPHNRTEAHSPRRGNGILNPAPAACRRLALEAPLVDPVELHAPFTPELILP